jgi:ABC-type transport system involved in multi-copper enzyme maturation permease subunit
MAKSIGLGPVFAAEWLSISRRWQGYAARVVFVAAVLGALTVVWLARAVNRPAHSVRAQAEVGRVFSGALAVTQLAMVLLVAPAATAGSICLDRARGTLDHMLVTDLSAAEIVLGKLAARLAPVLGVLLCIMPLVALGSLLGGIDPRTMSGAVLVALGAAASGSAAALALSTWGTKTHEVLFATYAVWVLWLLALPMWAGYRLLMASGVAPPTLLQKGNPIWLVAAPSFQPGAVDLADQAIYCGASLLAAAVLAAVAVVRLRRGAAIRTRRDQSRAWIYKRLHRFMPRPSLDANPVLWREWHRRRPSIWARGVWLVYAVMTVCLSVTLIVLAVSGGGVRSPVASMGNGFQAGIGLLLLTVSATTTLAEERVRGSLDVLLATPLSTRSIIWGKWWGTFRSVPLLAVAPGAVAAALARHSGRWEGAVLVVGLFLAYGAAVTSLGLALATWVRRIDHAVALGVAVLGGVTVGWLITVASLASGGAIPEIAIPEIAAGSPIIGMMFPTIGMEVLPTREWRLLVVGWCVWIGVYLGAAFVLAWATYKTFDRCLSRMPAEC